jgi:predicted MFS family arabinose efflux permease
MRDSLRAFRSAFANPSLRRLQLAYAGSSMGQWAASTAVTVFSFEAGGAGAVSLQLALRMIPAAVAAPIVSTVADRYSRVRVMVISDVLRVGIVLGMAALVAADVPYVLVLVSSSVSGIVATAFEPAKAALLPTLADKPDELTAANVASSSIDSLSIFVGPAIGGVLLAATSTEVVLCVTAATFLWSAVLVAAIRTSAGREQAEGEEEGPGLLGQVAEGFRTVAEDRALRLLVGFFAAQTFVDGALGVLLVATALDLLDLGKAGLGLLNSMLGVGGILGAAAAVTLTGRPRLVPAFGLGIALWGLPLMLLGLAPLTAVAVAALILVGLGNTLVDVSGMTLLQRAAPEPVVGRVFGILETLILASIALGAAVASAVVDAAGIEAALVATGALLPALVLVTWRGLRRIEETAVSPADIALLKGVEIFAPLGTVEIERLAEALEPLTVAAGEAITRQGDREADRFYVIVSGEVDVLVDGEHVRTEGPGDSFGEIALLRDVPRTATVVARNDVELRALRREVFLGAVVGHVGSAAAADAVVGGRLATAHPVQMAG